MAQLFTILSTLIFVTTMALSERPRPDPPEKFLESRDSLSEKLGFTAPQPLFDALSTFLKASSEEDSFQTTLEGACGIARVVKGSVWPTIPPEFHCFAGPGVGGGEFGYVNFNGEQTKEDYPVFLIYPIDKDPAAFIANGTMGAFETQLSDQLYMEVMEPGQESRTPLITELAALLQLKPDLTKRSFEPEAAEYEDDDGKPLILPKAHRPTFNPTIPKGWLFKKTPDGIGMAAPKDKFSASAKAPGKISELAAWAEKQIEAGAPASALYGIKCRFYVANYDEKIDDATEKKIRETMAKCYDALDQPTFAKRCRDWMRQEEEEARKREAFAKRYRESQGETPDDQ